MKYLIVFLSILLLLGACTQAQKQQAEPKQEEIAKPDTLSARDTAVMALVEKAVALMLEQGTTEEGRQAVFAQFDDIKGQFVEGEYYLFVYNLDGTVIAHEASPELIGKNLIDKEDADGVKMIAEMVNIAKEKGSGWISYLWPYPGTGEIKPKRAFIERPGEMEMFIGCGFYND